MRQAGTIPTEAEARRLADYLLTRDIEAQVDDDPEGWAIWIRDENHLVEARNLVKEFLENPDDPRYDEAIRSAGEIRRQAHRKAEQARKNVVDMRSQWNRGTVRRAPLTFTVIAASVLVFMLTDPFKGETAQSRSATAQTLLFCQTVHATSSVSDRLIDIRAGQFWRLITPIFIHWGPWHLAFNMYMFFYFGRMIEDRRGTLRVLLMILVMGVFSTVCQELIEGPRSVPPSFGGGMSGVLYGLFGYAWMKSMYDPAAGIHVPQSTVFILIAWFFLCLFGLIGAVANMAHGAGLVLGTAWGYAPVFWRSLKDQR